MIIENLLVIGRFAFVAAKPNSKGTIYCTPSGAQDPAVSEVWKEIDSMLGSAYSLPSKEYLIGLDETGKEEIIGHTVLTGYI